MSTTTDNAKFLQIQDVVKDYSGYKAVNNVNLDIAKGEIFALLGSSGCGKSTLLRMLAGFDTPTSGRIILNGQDMAPLAPYQRPLNMMFQSYALFPHLTVADNIAFGLRRDGMASAKVNERVDAMLKMVQLSKFAKRKPHQLSGGQQQRVALARSLAKQPQVLLLDEPLGALDKKLREETQIELVNIIRQIGVTCVMVTHDQEEAMTMASRIAVMTEGRFLQVASPREMYETPASRFVADFIGNVNLMDGVVIVDEPDHVVIECADCKHYVGHGITGTLGMPVSVALRPEKIALQRAKPEEDTNCITGVISEISYFGATTVIRIKPANGRVLSVTLTNTARQQEDWYYRGDQVWAIWSAQDHVVLTQ